MADKDLADRLFEFSVAVLLFVKTLPNTPENRIIRYQLVKSSSSSGANYEESQAGSSKPDFTNKIRISLHEKYIQFSEKLQNIFFYLFCLRTSFLEIFLSRISSFAGRHNYWYVSSVAGFLCKRLSEWNSV